MIGFTVVVILGGVDAFSLPLKTTSMTTSSRKNPTCFHPSLSSSSSITSPFLTLYSQENDDDSTKASSPDSLRRRTLLQSPPWAVAGAAALSSVLLFNTPSPAQAAYIDPATSPLKITDSVYFDVEYVDNKNTKQQGRIVIGVFGDALPKTAVNFVTLAKSNAYAGTSFYRIISELSIQGGAIGDPTGKTGKSSLDNGSAFEPDNYTIQHTQKGLVSMVRNTKEGGGVDSRFFIQLQDDAGWADDRYAAFGIVTKESFDNVVSKIAKVPVQPPKNNPIQEVTIVASGIL